MYSKVKIVISILSVTVILACLIQAIPIYNQLQQYNAIIDDSEQNKGSVEETITATEDLSVRSGSTADEADYRSTQEYSDNNSRILALKERINLLNNGITSDLTDLTKLVFNKITEISADPKNDKLRDECKQYMTDDYFERFKDTEIERESYMVYDIRFCDLDKDDISAYVLTRSSNQIRFFVTYSYEEGKNYVISDIKTIKNEV